MSDDDDKPGRALFGGILPDNVLVFPSLREMKESGGPVSRKPRDYAQCQHGHGVTVDGVDRTVTCKKCGKLVDAFEALLSLAHNWDWEHTRHAKAEANKEAEKVLADLQRLKAQRSNARNTGALSTASVKKVLTAIVHSLRAHIARQPRDKENESIVDAYQDAIRLVEYGRAQLLDGKFGE
jgi:hypothetical protein